MNCKLLVTAVLCIGSLTMSAQSHKGRKATKAAEVENNNPYEAGKTSGTVYLVGFSQAFGDSVAYMTTVNKVDSIDLMKKTNFLPFRAEFSLQFKEHVESKLGKRLETPVVFFSKKKNVMDKKLAKLKKRYLNTENTVVVEVGEKDFHFTHPVDVMNQYSAK